MASTNSDAPHLKLLADQWLQHDRNEDTRAVISELVKSEQWDELDKRLSVRISFGTAGLRAPMGAGFAFMNDLIVIQTTQGLCEYLLSTNLHATTAGVVIGHDHRHHSDRFARLAAAVFLSKNIPVFFYQSNVATPLVPFAVGKLKTCAGIMITASHNPKNDNGYKLYAANGAQIIPPVDDEISSFILRHLEPHTWDENILEHRLLTLLDSQNGRNLINEYIDDLYTNLTFVPSSSSSSLSPSFVYTAMHGVGHKFINQAFDRFGLAQPAAVAAQCTPDPDFPTVAFPNPEEGKGALKLAMSFADEIHGNIILANDPDADRLAVAERTASGTWKLFNGNEVGILLGWFMFEQQRIQLHADPKFAMLASAVSSTMLKTMASQVAPAIHFEQTLTGFKWLGNRALQLEAQQYKVLFAFEEAIGYMANAKIKDKDGISAAVALAHMAKYCYAQGRSLQDQLNDLYQKFGYFATNNSYFVCQSPAKIAAIFNRIRNFETDSIDKESQLIRSSVNSYPRHVGRFQVASVCDVTKGFDSNHQSTLPMDSSGNFIAFAFENGANVTLRASGTEPKLKYYAELRGELSHRGQVESELQNVVDDVVQLLLQPSLNGLIPRTS